jgi:UDP-3-O-[3-hydroxymyristoyl] glucosamine N-acyltransferase
MRAEHREPISLAVLADLVGGCVSGDPSTSVFGIAPLDLAGPDQISFLANPKYKEKLADCRAAAVIAHPSLSGSVTSPLILVENPYLAFAKILTFFEVTPHVGQGVMAGARGRCLCQGQDRQRNSVAFRCCNRRRYCCR